MTVDKEIATFHIFNNIYFDSFLYSHLFSTVALVIDLVVCFSRLVTIFPPSHHLRYSTQALSLSAPTYLALCTLCAFEIVFFLVALCLWWDFRRPLHQDRCENLEA